MNKGFGGKSKQRKTKTNLCKSKLYRQNLCDINNLEKNSEIQIIYLLSVGLLIAMKSDCVKSTISVVIFMRNILGHTHLDFKKSTKN